MAAQRTVIVVTGGDPVNPDVVARLPAAVAVVAADSGAEYAAALGLTIDLAVGDFDSVRPEVLAALVAAGTEIERHPDAKDATDLEMGLSAARRFDATDVVVVGGHGGRIDHFIANALLLASPAFADLRVVAHVGPARLTVIHDHARLTGQPGDLVSLLPVAGPVTGVSTRGLLYRLDGEDLAPGSTRGVSNELAESVADVSVVGGALLIVQPGGRGTHLDARLGPAASLPVPTPTEGPI